jgi:hypothetical protein
MLWAAVETLIDRPKESGNGIILELHEHPEGVVITPKFKQELAK